MMMLGQNGFDARIDRTRGRERWNRSHLLVGPTGDSEKMKEKSERSDYSMFITIGWMGGRPLGTSWKWIGSLD